MAIVIVLHERKNPGSTWAWLMVLFFLPVIGFFLYLFFGRSFKSNRRKNQSTYFNNELMTVTENQLRSITNGSFQHPVSVTQELEGLIRMNLQTAPALLTFNNRISIFSDGNDKFDALFEDIENAKSHIHLEYYIVRKDALAEKLLNLLTQKAKEGVKVLFMYDDVGSHSINDAFLAEFREAGGKAAPFMPSKVPIINPNMNYRNHRKIVIIDGTISYTGGFNVGEEYLGKKPKFGYWRDTHLRITGDAVHALQHRFLLDWNEASRIHPVKYASEYFPPAPERKGAAMQIVASGPDEKHTQIKNGMLKLIASAQESIYIQTPYFVPEQTIIDALRVASLGGVEVRMIIPDKSDHPFVHSATLSFIGDLLDAGVEVYTYHNGFLHAKMMMIDGKAFTLGSANIDIRSFRLNFEVNAFIYDRETTQAMMEVFFRDMELSGKLTQDYFDSRPLTTRIRHRFARLTAPLL